MSKVESFLKESEKLTGDEEKRRKQLDEEASIKLAQANILLDEAKRKTVLLDQKMEELAELIKFYISLVDEADEVVSQTLTLLRDKLKMQKMEGKF